MYLIWLDGMSEAFALLEQILAGARRRGLTLHSLCCEQRGCIAHIRMRVAGGDATAADRFTCWLGTVPAVSQVGRGDDAGAA